MGPTASGKTRLAESLANEIDAVLINADAFQMYRGLDIGTGKSSEAQRYRLISFLSPKELYGVGQFVRDAHQVLQEAWIQRKHVVLVGGTGLYIRAVMDGYADLREAAPEHVRNELNALPLHELTQRLRELDPAIEGKIDMANPIRVKRALEKLQSKLIVTPENPFERKVKLGFDPPMELLRQNIHSRIEMMVQNGWVEEVRGLQSEGYSQIDPAFRAIGYRDIFAYLADEISWATALENIQSETVKYAKRQKTWLRSEKGLKHLDTGPSELARALNVLGTECC
jgi:tRNA dimethylallyltransferase